MGFFADVFSHVSHLCNFTASTNSLLTFAARTKLTITDLGTCPKALCNLRTAILTRWGSLRQDLRLSDSSSGKPGISTSSKRVSSCVRSSTGSCNATSSGPSTASQFPPCSWESSMISGGKATLICSSNSCSSDQSRIH